MTEVLYYKPCSTCHNADCVWMGGQDTHKKCEDYQSLEQEPTAKENLVVAENTTSEQFGNSEELDCIIREQAIKCLECDFDITGRANMEVVVNYINSAHDKIMNLPSVKATTKQNLVVEAQEPCEDCCNGNQIEKAKLCQKSYIAGMEHKQEPKQGHWISRWYKDKHFYVCSECQEEFSHDAETGIELADYPICPNCGCRMESEVENGSN